MFSTNRLRPTFIARTFLSFLLLAGAGCASYHPDTRGSFLYFDSSQKEVKSERKPASVELFYKREPGQIFTEIGMVEALAEGHNVTLQDLMPELQKQAALMNADGIIKIEMQRFEASTEAFHATGVAIRFSSRGGVAPKAAPVLKRK